MKSENEENWNEELSSHVVNCGIKTYLHFVLECEGVTVHTGVSFKFTQYNTFLEEKDLSLMPSGARLDVWRFLPHCEDSLKERRQVKSLFLIRVHI